MLKFIDRYNIAIISIINQEVIYLKPYCTVSYNTVLYFHIGTTCFMDFLDVCEGFF